MAVRLSALSVGRFYPTPPGIFLVLICFKEDEMGRACSTNGAKRNAYRILVGKPEGKRPMGRPRRRWVDNIKIDLG
jgi:hypothetical protein